MTPLPELTAARGYLAAGLSVIPTKLDGSKAPAFAGWREYATRPPTAAELYRWFGRPDLHGVGIPGGFGGLAVLDFEAAAAYDTWLSLVPAAVRELVAASPTVATGGGGVHVYAKLGFPVPSGTVLARAANKDVLIETRGSGHYVVAPGSPARVHKTGVPYTFAGRGWLDAGAASAVWGEVEFADALAAVRSQNQYVPPAKTFEAARPRETPPGADDPGDRPGDRFNTRAEWEAILCPHGWKVVGRSEGRTLWLRPGKDRGISATSGYCKSPKGGDLFFVFTSSAPPLEPDHAYDRFGTFALLNHGGDLRAAARALAAHGYGSARPRVAVRVGKAVRA